MKHETAAALEQAMSLRTGAYWMPFTHNRYLKGNPRSRVLARAEGRSEEHTSELQSLRHLVCRLLLEKKKNKIRYVLANEEERHNSLVREYDKTHIETD